MWIMWILEGPPMLRDYLSMCVCGYGVTMMWMCVGMWSSFTPCWVSGARAIGPSVQALTSCTFEDWTGRAGASEAPLFMLSLGISCSVAWVGWGLCAGAVCGKLLEPRLLEKHKMLSFLIWGLAFQSKTWPLHSWSVCTYSHCAGGLLEESWTPLASLRPPSSTPGALSLVVSHNVHWCQGQVDSALICGSLRVRPGQGSLNSCFS